MHDREVEPDQQPHRRVRRVELLLDRLQQRVEDVAVGDVEERHQEQHAQHVPAVGAAVLRSGGDGFLVSGQRTRAHRATSEQTPGRGVKRLRGRGDLPAMLQSAAGPGTRIGSVRAAK